MFYGGLIAQHTPEIIATAPAAVTPVITGLTDGVAVVGSTLGVEVGGQTATGTIQWRSDGADIGGATSASLTVPDTPGAVISVVVNGETGSGVSVLRQIVVGFTYAGAVLNPGDTVTVTAGGTPATGGEVELTRGGQPATLSAGTYTVTAGDLGVILRARQTGLPSNQSAPETVQAPPAPSLTNAASATGSAMEGLLHTVALDDSWATDGAPATIATREYRLVVGGSPGAAQSSRTLTIPQATAGQLGQPQIRARTATSAFSAWENAGAGFTILADIPLNSSLPGVSGSQTEGDTRSISTSDAWSLDGAPASIAAREYRLVLDGTPGTAQTSATLALPFGTAGQSAQLQLRARTATSDWSAWTDAEPAFTMQAGTMAPGQIGAGDWDITDAGTGGDANVTVTTLPGDGGSALTGLFVRIGAGAAIPLGGAGTGTYPLNDFFTDGVAASVTIFARNAVGDGPNSAAKSITTSAPATAPAGFGTGQWAIADLGSGGDAEITVTGLPDDGGSPLTGLFVRIGSGALTALGGAGTGTYTLSDAFTDNAATNVTILARNAVGDGPESAAKSVTTTGSGPSISLPDPITSFIATGSGVAFTLPADPPASGATVNSRLVAVVPLGQYTGNEQASETWTNAIFLPSQPAQGSDDATGLAEGDWVLTWEARDTSFNPRLESPWSTGTVFTVASSTNAPAPFASGQWSIADLGTGGDAQITVTSLPDDGGSPISALFARVNGGPAINLGGGGTGTYLLANRFTDGVAASVTIFALNAEGEGAEGPAKSITTSAPGGGSTQVLSHNGLSFTVTEVLDQGVHADGSPWVVVGAGGQITGTTPASGQVARSYVGGSSSEWSHGMQYAPGRAAVQSQTLAQRQASATNYFGVQGYDGLVRKANFIGYTASLNIDPGATGAPVTLQPGVYVKAQSKLSGIDSQGRPVLETFGVLSVYTSAPAGDAFRTPFAGDGTPTGFAASDLNMGLLSNRSSAGYSDGVLPYATAMGFLSQVLTFQHCYGVNSENITPVCGADAFNTGNYQTSSYMGDVIKVVGEIMLMLHYDTWSTAQKRGITAKIVQMGFDIAERIRQGGIFYANGGHSHGRKFILAFAAEMLDAQDLRDACALTNQGSAYDSSYPGMSLFGEDEQAGFVTSADISASAGVTSGGRSLQYNSAQLGWPEWVGEDRTENLVNTLGNSIIWPYVYRDVATKGLIPAALAVRMTPGARATMGSLSDALFDWCDRYMGYWLGDTPANQYAYLNGADVRLPQGNYNAVSLFCEDAWTAERGTVGSIWPNQSSATPPTSFGTGQWSLSDLGTGGDARITITGLPADGGSAITALQYRIGAGGWSNLGGTGTGTYDLIDLFANGVATDVTLRALNVEGAGAASAAKTVSTSGGGGVSGPLTMAAMPFDGYVFDADGQSSAQVTLRGTGTTGNQIQVRGESAGGNTAWTSAIVNSAGDWSVTFAVSDMSNWYIPAARIGTDDGTKITTANSFGCGDVLGIFGQSELAYFLLTTPIYNQVTRSLDAENLTVMLDDDISSGAGTARITNANLSSANAGCLALANLMNHVAPGRKLMVVDLAHAGMAPQSLADDSNASRSWTPFQTMVDLVRAGGSDFGGIIQNWYNAPATTIPFMLTDWAPFMFGQRASGAAFTLGTNNTEGAVWTGRVDHCLWDIEAPAASRGRGVFARARTKLHLMLPMPYLDSNGIEDSAFDESLRVSNPARAGVLAFAADPRVQTFLGAVGPSTHIVKFGGASTEIHPDRGPNTLGTVQFALLHGPAMLRQAGVTVGEPLLGTPVVTGANTVEIPVDLPNGGTLTTLRAHLGNPDPTTEPPHYQDVVGFQIDRAAGTKRPVYKTSETSYPALYRGTVTIIDSGTGTAPARTGRVQVTLSQPIATGDQLTYLDGQGTAVLQEPRDLNADLFQNMLIEHIPAWSDSATEHPFHGIPVRPQTPMAALTAGGGDAIAPSLSTPAGAADGASAYTGSVTSNEGTGTLYVLASGNASESVATVKAQGAAQTVLTAGVQTVAGGGLTASTSYRLHFVHSDAAGNDSTVASSAAFTTDAAGGDTTAPVLSSAAASANGQTAFTGSVSTDEAGGTLYVLASVNSTETAATIKASGSAQAVSGTGGQVVSGGGLTADTTYRLHFVHSDAAGNDSAALASGPFTTQAGGGAWAAPGISGTGDGQVTLARGANPPAAPAAPLIDGTGDGQVSLNAQ